MYFEMLREVSNALGKQRHLHLNRSGIGIMDAIFLDECLPSFPFQRQFKFPPIVKRR